MRAKQPINNLLTSSINLLKPLLIDVPVRAYLYRLDLGHDQRRAPRVGAARVEDGEYPKLPHRTPVHLEPRRPAKNRGSK